MTKRHVCETPGDFGSSDGLTIQDLRRKSNLYNGNEIWSAAEEKKLQQEMLAEFAKLQHASPGSERIVEGGLMTGTEPGMNEQFQFDDSTDVLLVFFF